MAWHLIVALFIVGAWGLVCKRNLIKKIIAVSILNSAVVMLFVYMGSLTGRNAPIMVRNQSEVVDPLPQALMLTAIVVGICLTALATVFVYIIYQRRNSLDIRELERQGYPDE